MLEVADRMNAAYENKMKSDAAIIAEALMMSKTDGVSPTVIHQTVNFNQPVETAGDVAARMSRLNEELGMLLNGLWMVWGAVVLVWADVAQLIREETLRTKKCGHRWTHKDIIVWYDGRVEGWVSGSRQACKRVERLIS